MKKLLCKYLIFSPLMLFASGAFGQGVAPYPYSESQSYDLVEMNKKQEKFLIRRLEASPDSALDMAALASTYVTQSNLTGDLKKMDMAEKKAKESLEKLPFFNSGPKLVLAQVAESRHQFAEAISMASELLKENPQNPGALSVLITSHLGFGQTAEALRYAEELVKFSPGVESFTFRALTSLARGMEVEGVADFNRALSLEGASNRLQSSWVRTLIARHYFRTGNMSEAEKYVDSALIVDPEYHVAVALKARLLAIRGENELAEKNYAKAISLRAEPPYYLEWALLKECLDDKNGARSLRREIEPIVRAEIEETPYGHHNELAALLIDGKGRGDRDEAIREAMKDVEQRNTSESYYLLARAFMNNKQFAEAQIAIQKALDSGEKNCEYAALASEVEAFLAGKRLHIFAECPQYRIP